MSPIKWTSFILILALSLTLASPAMAEDNQPQTPNNCILCHENLYYLHDTGKYFCISEASQRCTDCHGGDPAATDKDFAHQNRSAHPVINEDISKCQECHPNDCEQYVQKFNEVAGISPVLVTSKPILFAAPSGPETSSAQAGELQPGNFSTVVVAGGLFAALLMAVLIAYLRRPH